MNWKRCGRNWLWPNLRCFPVISLERQVTIKIICQSIWFSGWGTELGTSWIKVRSITAWPILPNNAAVATVIACCKSWSVCTVCVYSVIYIVWSTQRIRWLSQYLVTGSPVCYQCFGEPAIFIFCLKNGGSKFLSRITQKTVSWTGWSCWSTNISVF
jgi:hypothetical protein